ncbi:MAG: Mut7-C RNAse domain-containing protein [Infirmifilum sp.]
MVPVLLEVVADGMLGKLSRWLRLLGVRTIYLRDFKDAEIKLFLATHNKAVFLTRDKILYRELIRKNIKALLVPDGPEEDVLAWVLSRLDIKPEFNPEKALCSLCGAPLVKVDKEQIKDNIPLKVRDTYNEFYMCTGCGQIYWLGTHVVEIEKKIEKVRCIIYGKTIC